MCDITNLICDWLPKNKLLNQLSMCVAVEHTSFVPRPHPRGEEKGSGYNTTSRSQLLLNVVFTT